MRDRIKQEIIRALNYKKQVEDDSKSWQSVFQNYKVKNAQSWNPETNRKYRNGLPGNSALVKSIKYNDKKHILEVTYRDNFTAVYKDVTARDVAEFVNSDSKGRWALKNLWSKDYDRK